MNLATPYYKGQNEEHYPGRRRCGSLEAITDGGRTGVDPVITTDARGNSPCCTTFTPITTRQIQPGTLVSGGISFSWGFTGTIPTTSYIWLLVDGTPADDLPFISGWEIIQLLQWPASTARMIVYQRHWTDGPQPNAFVSSSGRPTVLGLVGTFRPGPCTLSQGGGTDFGALSSGPASLSLPPLTIHGPGRILVTMWCLNSGDVPSGPGVLPPIPVGIGGFGRVMTCRWDDAPPVGITPTWSFTFNVAFGGRYQGWENVITGP